MAKRSTRPSWFKMFIHQKALIDSVPDDTAGKALKAVFRYFDSGEDVELDPLSFAVFAAIKPYVDEAYSDFKRDVENGRKGGRPKKPPVTVGYHGKPNQTEAEAEADAEADTDGELDIMGMAPKSKRFSPPSVDEVRFYCQEKGYSVDSQRFVDYYTSNGWMVGRNKMKDWKAAVRTWNSKNTANNNESRQGYTHGLDMLSQMYKEEFGSE